MRLRHAAAFALAGWYLVEPPRLPPSYHVDQSAPLSQWSLLGSFDSATECTIELGRFASNPPRYPNEPDLEKSESDRMHMAQCIATDDPRLKNR
jgi:hypothetical protein